MPTSLDYGVWNTNKTHFVWSHVLAIVWPLEPIPFCGSCASKLRLLCQWPKLNTLPCLRQCVISFPCKPFFRNLALPCHLISPTPTLLHSKVFEDNNGALQLSCSPKITMWTKHIAIKYHHFHSHVGPSKRIDIIKIDTKVQKANIFTKGLAADQFATLCLFLLGW